MGFNEGEVLLSAIGRVGCNCGGSGGRDGGIAPSSRQLYSGCWAFDVFSVKAASGRPIRILLCRMDDFFICHQDVVSRSGKTWGTMARLIRSARFSDPLPNR